MTRAESKFSIRQRSLTLDISWQCSEVRGTNPCRAWGSVCITVSRSPGWGEHVSCRLHGQLRSGTTAVRWFSSAWIPAEFLLYTWLPGGTFPMPNIQATMSYACFVDTRPTACGFGHVNIGRFPEREAVPLPSSESQALLCPMPVYDCWHQCSGRPMPTSAALGTVSKRQSMGANSPLP